MPSARPCCHAGSVSRAAVPEVDYLRTSSRLRFGDLPSAVHRAVADSAGADVAAAGPPVTSGFGGAYAGLVDLADGRRAFVKAAGPAHPHVLGALARESVLLPQLSVLECSPRVVGGCEVDAKDGTWRVLVLEALDGTQPGAPWTEEDVAAVHDACVEIASTPPAVVDALSLTSAADDLQSARDVVPALTELASGARSFPTGHVVPERAALDELVGLAAGIGDAVRGDRLVHLDLRPDNLLRQGDGRMRVVDWNQAVAGPAWLDLVTLWPLMHHQGVDLRRFDESPLLAGSAPDDHDALLAFLVGFMLAHVDAPPPPGCTTALRAHAVFFSDTTLRLLAHRRGWEVGTAVDR